MITSRWYCCEYGVALICLVGFVCCVLCCFLFGLCLTLVYLLHCTCYVGCGLVFADCVLLFILLVVMVLLVL